MNKKKQVRPLLSPDLGELLNAYKTLSGRSHAWVVEQATYQWLEQQPEFEQIAEQREKAA